MDQQASSPLSARDTGSPPAGAPLALAGGDYQVLARKYRPTRFSDLAGQESMVRTLENAFAAGRIAHAFMLTGVRGVGKTTTARLLARALNYSTPERDRPSIDLDPPGVHCSAIMSSTHPDVLELDAASRTGVEAMRDLLDGVRYAPVSARYKVYIIDEVHMLSMQAFNALLKTLEEPPPHVKFIFATTEIRRVPITVLSRCQRFNLQRFTPDGLMAFLAGVCAAEGVAIAEEALAVIARAAEGSARDALSILDQAIVRAAGAGIDAGAVRDMLGMADRGRTEDLLSLILSVDRGAVLREVEAQIAAGAEGASVIRDLLDLVAECARAEALGDGYRLSSQADGGRSVAALAARMSPGQSARLWRILLTGYEDCQRAPDPQMAAAMVALRLVGVMALPPPEDVVKLLGAEHDGAGARGALHPPAAPARAAVRSGDGAARDDAPPGPVLATLAAIMDELERQREIELKYDVEQYVRPASIAYGRFVFADAPGAPADLPTRLRGWLESVTGVEWEVSRVAEGAAESPAEKRARLQRQRRAEAEAHPRIRQALATFPGAEILMVDDMRALAAEIYADEADAPEAAVPAPDDDEIVRRFAPDYLQPAEEDDD
jgi:DNA polymerase-3 subunit gamma/tau